MENKKKIIMVVLSVIVCVMAVGYAVLSQQLNINGTASIDSTWKVEITNITEKDIVGDASSKETPSYTSTTANFSVGLIQPGDSITYDVEVSNLGTLKAKVDSISVVTGDNDAIIYTTDGIAEGDKLAVGAKDILTVKVQYNPEVTSQPSLTNKDITVVINYVQDLSSDEVVTPEPEPEPEDPYTAYTIGQRVTLLDDSTWYVVSDSAGDNEYVTLIKEYTLTDNSVFDDNTSWGYASSRIEYVLNNEYLPTLTSINGFNWDDNSSIRLIYWDEYTALYNTEGTSEWLYGDGYWWALRSDGLRALVYPDGSINNDESGYSNGVRPVIITKKANIK